MRHGSAPPGRRLGAHLAAAGAVATSVNEAVCFFCSRCTRARRGGAAPGCRSGRAEAVSTPAPPGWPRSQAALRYARLAAQPLSTTSGAYGTRPAAPPSRGEGRQRANRKKPAATRPPPFLPRSTPSAGRRATRQRLPMERELPPWRASSAARPARGRSPRDPESAQRRADGRSRVLLALPSVRAHRSHGGRQRRPRGLFHG